MSLGRFRTRARPRGGSGAGGFTPPGGFTVQPSITGDTATDALLTLDVGFQPEAITYEGQVENTLGDIRLTRQVLAGSSTGVIPGVVVGDILRLRVWAMDSGGGEIAEAVSADFGPMTAPAETLVVALAMVQDASAASTLSGDPFIPWVPVEGNTQNYLTGQAVDGWPTVTWYASNVTNPIASAGLSDPYGITWGRTNVSSTGWNFFFDGLPEGEYRIRFFGGRNTAASVSWSARSGTTLPLGVGDVFTDFDTTNVAGEVVAVDAAGDPEPLTMTTLRDSAGRIGTGVDFTIGAGGGGRLQIRRLAGAAGHCAYMLTRVNP